MVIFHKNGCSCNCHKCDCCDMGGKSGSKGNGHGSRPHGSK
ncbi:MAG: hypothetical protein WA432_01630 [Candidatus Babeliaceae bacterium]